MASSILRANCGCVLVTDYKTFRIIPLARCLFRAFSLGDNMKETPIPQGHTLHGEQKSDKDFRMARDSAEENVIPFSVRQIRSRLKYLHNLPGSDQAGLVRKPLPHVPINNEEEEHVQFDDEASTNTEDSMDVIKAEDIREKFGFLRRQRRGESEKVIQTLYGYVRLDTDVIKTDATDNESLSERSDASGSKLTSKDCNRNVASSKMLDAEHVSFQVDETFESGHRKHGKKQRPENISKRNRRDEVNIFDEQYFKTEVHPSSNNSSKQQMFQSSEGSHECEKTLSDTARHDTGNEDRNIFDREYFGREMFPSSGRLEIGSEPRQSTSSVKQNTSEMGFVDHQYFVDGVNGVEMNNERKTSDHVMEKQALSASGDVPDFSIDHEEVSAVEARSEVISEDSENVYVKSKTKQEQRLENKVKPNLEKPETPYDLAMKIRREERKKAKNSPTEMIVPKDCKWTGETDSKGFRILKHQVLDIQNMPRDVVVKILKDSILYEDDGLIAIDKPYGLPSHGGPGVHHSVGQLLEPLAKICHLEHDRLYLVHRLDKETTGVMLLAKTPQTQNTIHNMFVKQKVIKKYWLITKGIPEPSEGVIDIPMAEGDVGDKKRMTLKPRYPKEYKLMLKASRRQQCFEAVTNYKVLDCKNNAALVECQPESGIKHQIRCHMAFALNTPILGDHKYSHFSKLAPQKLHPEILQRLGIRQAKARHVPMHLHARMVVLPEYMNGRNLFITANLPRHFKQNMKWLKLSPP